ncbi:MAG TPA: hypothetical protein VJ583_06910 [Nitrososphaeraceae archaeon]|nr:hypothetical protein [Nitrososphaeraceae archaeon]
MMIRISLSNHIFYHRNSNNKKNNARLEENKQLELSSKCIETESITFNELCPIWSKKLSLGLDRRDKFMIERDSKYCIVGEAWKFSRRYTGYYLDPLIPLVGCWTCTKYSHKFAKISKNKNKKENLTRSDFEPFIEYFMKHWNEKHVNEKI